MTGEEKEFEEFRQEFIRVARPLIKFMAEKCHPHMTAVVDSTDAELVEGFASYNTDEFLVD